MYANLLKGRGQLSGFRWEIKNIQRAEHPFHKMSNWKYAIIMKPCHFFICMQYNVK